MQIFTRFSLCTQFWLHICLLLGSIFFCGHPPILAQQIPLFTQYVYEPSLYSPALAGASETPQLNLGHRSQWIGIESAPSSQYLGFSGMRIKGRAIAIGGMLFNDQVHLLRQTHLSIFAAYHLHRLESPHQFSIGISGGFVNRQLNLSGEVAIEDANDPLVLDRSYRKLQLDAGLGFFYQYEEDQYRWYMGASMAQLPATMDLDKGIGFMLRNHVLATIGARFPIHEQVSIEPILLWRGIPGEYSLGGGGVDLGMQIHLMDDKLWLGGGIRPQQGGIHGVLGLDFDKFSLTALYESHRFLGPSLEFGAGIPIVRMPNRSSRPKAVSVSPKPSSQAPKPKPQAGADKPKIKREAYWENTEALMDSIQTLSTRPEKCEVISLPDRRGVLLSYQFSAESDDYLVSKVPDLDMILAHISGTMLDILDSEQRPHLKEIVSIHLVSLLQDDKEILAAPAYVRYDGEWGDRLIKTYELDGEIIAEIIKQGKINRIQQAYLKLLSIQKQLSADLNVSERTFDVVMETESTDEYLHEIKIEVIVK